MDKLQKITVSVITFLIVAAIIGIIALVVGWIWLGVQSVWSLIL